MVCIHVVFESGAGLHVYVLARLMGSGPLSTSSHVTSSCSAATRVTVGLATPEPNIRVHAYIDSPVIKRKPNHLYGGC